MPLGRLPCADERLQQVLQVLVVGRRFFVQDDKVHFQSFHAPKFMGPKDVPDEVPLFGLFNLDQNDRKVSRNPGGPKARRPARVPLHEVGRGAEGRIGMEDASRHLLKKVVLSRRHSQVVLLNLRLGPGQIDGAFKHSGVVVLVGEGHRGLTGGGREGCKRDARGFARLNAHAPAQADDGVQHSAHRVGKGFSIHHADRRAQAPPSPQEPGPVGFVFRGAQRGPFFRDHMGDPGGGIPRFPALPRAEEAVDSRHELCANEKVRKRRMGLIGRRESQNDFRVGGELDVPRGVSQILNGDPTDFRVIFGRDHDFKGRRDGPVPPADFGAFSRKIDTVGFRLRAHRLVSRGPDPSTLDVSKIEVGAVSVPRRVFPPSSHRQVFPTRKAGPGGGHHDRVSPIGQ